VLLGRGEEMSGGRTKKALLSDAVEALIAALYLDAGLQAAQTFIEERVVGGLEAAEEGLDGAVADHKSALQEMAQALKLPAPRYVVVDENGPEHSKTFTVEVRLGKEWVSQAQGLSKKSAGQKAALWIAGIVAHQIGADHKSQDGVAQEFELFVISLGRPGRRLLVDMGSVGQGPLEQLAIAKSVPELSFKIPKIHAHRRKRTGRRVSQMHADCYLLPSAYTRSPLGELLCGFEFPVRTG
jgi:hypothetical protein